MQPIVSPWYLYLMNACDMLHLAFMFSFGVCTLKGLFDLFLPNKIPQRLVNENLKYFTDHADICDEAQMHKLLKSLNDYKNQQKRCYRWIFAGIACLLLACAIPDKEVMSKMMVASYITPDNIQFIKSNYPSLHDITSIKDIFTIINDIANDIANIK